MIWSCSYANVYYFTLYSTFGNVNPEIFLSKSVCYHGLTTEWPNSMLNADYQYGFYRDIKLCASRMTTALTSMFQYFFPHCTLSLTIPDLHNASKKFVAALRKLLLQKRIASHKKILYPRNIRVFHEKYVYKKTRKKIFSFRRRIMRPFSVWYHTIASHEIVNNCGKLFRTIVLMCERVKFVSLRRE